MSSQSSGDHNRDDSALPESATPRPQHLSAHLAALGTLVAPHGNSPYKALSKTLNRPVIAGNPNIGVPSAPCSASPLSTLHPTVRLTSSMEGGKSLVTTSSSIVSLSLSSTQQAHQSSILPTGTTASSHGTVVPISSILRGTGSGGPFPAHLPKGAAAAASALAGPKSATTAMPVLRQHVPINPPPMTLGHSSGHTSLPRGQHITPNIRPATPPQTISPSGTVGVGTLSAPHSDSHRMGIAMQTTSGSSSTPSIQITLQASRTTSDPAPKHVLSQPTAPKQIHIAQAHSVNTKVNMSQAAVSPIIHQISTAALPKHTAVPTVVTPSLQSPGPLSISSVLSSVPPQSTASSTIPIAKVPPVRQLQPSTLAGQLSASPSTSGSSGTESAAPQDQASARETSSQSTTSSHQPAQSHSQPTLGNPSSSIFLSQPQRANPVVSSSIGHSDGRLDRPAMYGMPFFNFSTPEYHQIMYQQIAQTHGGITLPSGAIRPGLLPTAIQAAPTGITVTSAPAVRFNPMMVAMDPMVRQQTMPVHTPLSSASVTMATTSDGSTRSSVPVDSLTTMSAIAASSAAIPVPALSMAMQTSAASVLYSMSSTSPHPGSLTPQHSRSENNSVPVSTPNASPRPSILRKRPNEGNVPVKKPVCGLNTMVEKTTAADRHSPRPDSRTDSAPQSNTSSPKTPATPAGESQSSTDTALSSEATTPTQNSMADLKIKQEPSDALENGFPTASSIASSLPGSLPNSVEASPRKKPRKQLLHANEELKDNTSTDEEFEKIEVLKEEIPNEVEVKKEQRDEYVDDEGVRWTIERTKPSISLLNFYNISWKPRNNHFHRYTDVKPKEERRPTVNELSNQKGIVQKASGWKLYHMAAQLEDLTELEKSLNTTVSMIQASMAPRPPSKHSVMEDDMGMLHELTQGNIQRCQLITDQLEEAKSSMFKVLDHKQKIFEIINKHMSKRPIKKKERT